MSEPVDIDLKSFRGASTLRVVFDAAAIWAVIFLSLAVAIVSDNMAVYALAFFIIATRQLALSHMVHSASHYNFSRDKARNDLISDVFFAAPVLISTAGYRAQHNPHHYYVGEPGRDTDTRSWYNIKGARGVRRLLAAFFFGEAMVTIRSYLSPKNRSGSKADVLRLVLFAGISHALILLVCAWLGNWTAYVWLWVLPLFTLTPMLIVLRVIAEHQSIDYAALGHDEPQRPFDPPLTRTIYGGRLGQMLLGSYNFCYHHEHHLYPGIHYLMLPALHARLRETGYYDAKPEALSPSYAHTLRQLMLPAKGAAHGSL